MAVCASVACSRLQVEKLLRFDLAIASGFTYLQCVRPARLPPALITLYTSHHHLMVAKKRLHESCLAESVDKAEACIAEVGIQQSSGCQLPKCCVDTWL